jgi:glutamate racemase
VEAAEAKLRGETPDPAAVSEAIEGLFGAGGDANVDVVALACTHFPLLVPELAAAAPRACLWMDSGAAIARRVADVLSAAPGHARARRAGFTDIAAARSVFAAFELRGFTSFAEIGPPPAFDAAPLLDTASA